MSATTVSDCPTPTVSTSTVSNPAAAMTTIASRVARATPPRVPDDGEGRTNASGLAASFAIRVLSPRMLPPVRVDDGSTASTATRCPASISRLPSASMNARLADAGYAGDADADRVGPTGVGQQLGSSTCCASSR